MPEVHIINKGINPDIKPERQALKSQNPTDKSGLGHQKEGLRRDMRTQTQAQAQVQIKDENQTREQALINKGRPTGAPD